MHRERFRRARMGMQMEGGPFPKYLPIAADSRVHHSRGSHRPLWPGHLAQANSAGCHSALRTAPPRCASAAQHARLSFSRHLAASCPGPRAGPPRKRCTRNRGWIYATSRSKRADSGHEDSLPSPGLRFSATEPGRTVVGLAVQHLGRTKVLCA